ncbi:MAG: hypothetical protein E7607_07235 [Ruminococcaceae bacterium]|nr:hypothetical protein [Oscillospiraceae bacterium]
MLKVLPVQSKAEQEELCKKCNITFKPDLLMYAASVEGELVGVCQFKLSDKGGLIYDIAKVEGRVETKREGVASDFEAMFVMGRGALNFIDLCGVHRAFFVGQDTDDALLRAIGFKQNSAGEYEIDLTGFFTDHCH